MTKSDIVSYNIGAIETIKDFVDFWSQYYGLDYQWKTDDGEKSLMVWIDFKALESFTKLFSSDTINENYQDFECILRAKDIVFPNFENILPYCDIDENDIQELFPF
jgi:hypothetical protein